LAYFSKDEKQFSDFILGKRSSGKGNSSDHEGCWNEENWAFSQSGTSGNKKLKKTKPKEEFVFG